MRWQAALLITLAAALILGGTIAVIVGEYRANKRRQRYNRFEARVGRTYFSEFQR